MFFFPLHSFNHLAVPHMYLRSRWRVPVFQTGTHCAKWPICDGCDCVTALTALWINVCTLRMMSPSCRFPSLAARPVLVICLMKIWLPRRRPYSKKKHTKTSKRPQLLQTPAGTDRWYFRLEPLDKKVTVVLFSGGSGCLDVSFSTSTWTRHHNVDTDSKNVHHISPQTICCMTHTTI